MLIVAIARQVVTQKQYKTTVAALNKQKALHFGYVQYVHWTRLSVHLFVFVFGTAQRQLRDSGLNTPQSNCFCRANPFIEMECGNQLLTNIWLNLDFEPMKGALKIYLWYFIKLPDLVVSSQKTLSTEFHVIHIYLIYAFNRHLLVLTSEPIRQLKQTKWAMKFRIVLPLNLNKNQINQKN